MNPFLAGFADELIKQAGVLKSVGGFVVKHPWEAILGATTAAGAGLAATGAYKEGLKGGERPRYLPASASEGPSQAAYTNYNQLFERQPSRQAVREQSRFYNSEKFKR